MPTFLMKLMLGLLLMAVTAPQESDAEEMRQWCVANVQTPHDVLKDAIYWACGRGGANCTMIEKNQPCFLPNTIKDHASVVFNSYYQHSKNRQGSCYFKGAAIITERDPSHGSCKYEYVR